MPTAFSILVGREVDTASEEWRHECECRALLRMMPTRQQKHMHLYGVTDRSNLFRRNAKTSDLELREDYQKLWPRDDRGRTIKPLMSWRGLEQADRILEDAKRLYELNQQPK